jgi:hypothetical protein
MRSALTRSNNPQRAGRTFAMAEMGSFINGRGFPVDIFV